MINLFLYLKLEIVVRKISNTTVCYISTTVDISFIMKETLADAKIWRKQKSREIWIELKSLSFFTKQPSTKYLAQIYKIE